MKSILKPLIALIMIAGISEMALATAKKSPERKATALDTFLNQSLSEQKDLNHAYDQKQELTQTNNFTQEENAVSVEMGAEMLGY